MSFLKVFLKIILILVIPILVSGCAGKKKKPADNPAMQKALPVDAMVVRPQDMKSQIQATGTLIANEQVELRSEVPGRITAINFDEGTHVRKGDLLVKINDQDLQAQLEKLKLDEKLASDDVYRKKRLLEMKAVSQEEYDKSANQLAIIQAQMDLVNAQIDKTEILAPFNGVIGLRHVSPGEYVSTTTIIANLVQTDPMKIDVSIPEKYREKIRKGTQIRFSVEGMDSTFTGTVYAIEPQIDPSTRNVMLRSTCTNPGNLLVPGAFARVEILLQNIPDALVVPSEAIIPQLSGEKVYLFRNGKAFSQVILTGLRTENAVQVTSGLKPGDTVLTTGVLQLRDGMTVQVRLPKNAMTGAVN